jgi:hypothetical protein
MEMASESSLSYSTPESWRLDCKAKLKRVRYNNAKVLLGQKFFLPLRYPDRDILWGTRGGLFSWYWQKVCALY